jgi:hypothetical protein
MDWNLAFLISGAGYGITILVLGIISMLIWLISVVIKGNKKAA